MSAGSSALQTAENGNGGNKRKPCPLHGCKRVYADVSALEAHIKDHEIAAQSLPGKVLLCSTVGCSSSFANMQKLMEHMRHHHKPNIFFLCESCRTKLRSYRGLLTHLHTCSKVPRGKTKPTEPMPPLPAAVTDRPLVAMDQNPPRTDSVSTPQQLSFYAAPQPDSAVAPLLCSPLLSNPETSYPELVHQQLTDAASQSQPDASDLPPSLNLVGPTAASDPPDAQSQQNKSPEPVHPALGRAPHSPPGSSAVWKKNHGMACSRRILWEHTKGRYTCVQCGHTVTNRKDMTHHISTQHSGSKPAEESGRSAASL